MFIACGVFVLFHGAAWRATGQDLNAYKRLAAGFKAAIKSVTGHDVDAAPSTSPDACMHVLCDGRVRVPADRALDTAAAAYMGLVCERDPAREKTNERAWVASSSAAAAAAAAADPSAADEPQPPTNVVTRADQVAPDDGVLLKDNGIETSGAEYASFDDVPCSDYVGALDPKYGGALESTLGSDDDFFRAGAIADFVYRALKDERAVRDSLAKTAFGKGPNGSPNDAAMTLRDKIKDTKGATQLWADDGITLDCMFKMLCCRYGPRLGIKASVLLFMRNMGVESTLKKPIVSLSLSLPTKKKPSVADMVYEALPKAMQYAAVDNSHVFAAPKPVGAGGSKTMLRWVLDGGGYVVVDLAELRFTLPLGLSMPPEVAAAAVEYGEYFADVPNIVARISGPDGNLKKHEYGAEKFAVYVRPTRVIWRKDADGFWRTTGSVVRSDRAVPSVQAAAYRVSNNLFGRVFVPMHRFMLASDDIGAIVERLKTIVPAPASKPEGVARPDAIVPAAAAAK